MRYEYLREFANTDRQREFLDALSKTTTVAQAAKMCGINERNMYMALGRLKKRAAKQGVAPEELLEQRLPAGQNLKGVTYYTSDDGEVIPRWIKTQADKATSVQELMEEALEGLLERVPRAEKVAKPGHKNGKSGQDIANVHILTDYHLGMYAWGEESGEDYDLKIAEELLTNWFGYAIRNAPAAETGVLAQLGDFLHWDGMDAVTPTNRNILDADTRFQKVVRVAIRSLRRIVAMMLKKYGKVHLVMADANHDPASSAWLREVFAVFYEDEPRITVDRSPDTFYCYEHGLTSLFFHHGHRRKPTNIDDVMVAKFRDVFGRTRHSYAHLGHMHHKTSIETNLMLVEQHRTMAARDAYAASHGWMAGRSASVISYHKEYGEVGRIEISPEMV